MTLEMVEARRQNDELAECKVDICMHLPVHVYSCVSAQIDMHMCISARACLFVYICRALLPTNDPDI